MMTIETAWRASLEFVCIFGHDGKVLPSQRLLKQFEERLVIGEMNLSEIVRSGAQMMLQYALEREVTEALGRSYYENAPATTGSGNA